MVRFTEKYIFILDRFSPSKSLYVFNHDGKYVGKRAKVSVNGAKELRPAYSLKFGGKPFPDSDYIMAHKDNIVKDLETDGYIQWCDVQKNSSAYLSYWGSGKEIYWGKYELSAGTSWYVKRSNLEDDLGVGALSRPKTVFRDRFVSFISTENVDWERLPEHSILKKHLTKEDIDANPIVLLYQ